MSGDVQLMLMIAGVHALGLACVAVLILPALREPPDSQRGSESDSDDGWGHGPPQPPKPPESPRGGLPLPDALPARVRLRDHHRMADLMPPRERRPAREPERAPTRTGGWGAPPRGTT